jgi:FkbM family methyltransferase
VLDAVLYRLSRSARARRWSITLVRAYLRHSPFAAGKVIFWSRVVDPYLAWHSYPFVASTVFGARMAGDTQDMLQQHIYYFGVWEPDLTRYVAKCLTPGDAFVDVGANVGYYSLLASKLVGDSGKVIAIEALPSTFDTLQGNLTRNRASNVRAVNVAASDSAEAVSIFTGPKFNIGETTVVERPGFTRVGSVEAAPLSAILDPREARSARLIKVDVEGAELTVIRGMDSLFDSCRSDLEVIVEIHPRELAQQGLRPEDVLDLLLKAGFHPYELVNDYSVSSCVGRSRPCVPVRVRGRIRAETLVVFSRRDAEALVA